MVYQSGYKHVHVKEVALKLLTTHKHELVYWQQCV